MSAAAPHTGRLDAAGDLTAAPRPETAPDSAPRPTTPSAKGPTRGDSASRLCGVKGTDFRASWHKGLHSWLVKLEPRKRMGRVPRLGTALDVEVRRRDATVRVVRVKIVERHKGEPGRRAYALAEPLGRAT